MSDVVPNRRGTAFEDDSDQFDPSQRKDREMVARQVVVVRHSPRRPVPNSPREVDHNVS